jgi:hypothetical protein
MVVNINASGAQIISNQTIISIKIQAQQSYTDDIKSHFRSEIQDYSNLKKTSTFYQKSI